MARASSILSPLLLCLLASLLLSGDGIRAQEIITGSFYPLPEANTVQWNFPTPSRLDLLDYNADLWIDFLVLGPGWNFVPPRLKLFKNLAGKNWTEATDITWQPPPDNFDMLSFKVADFNGDLQPDVIVTGNATTVVYEKQGLTFVNRTATYFTASPIPPPHPITDNGIRMELCVVDYNNDLRPDLFFSYPITLYENTGANFVDVTSAVFGYVVLAELRALQDNDTWATWADFDSDGLPDLLFVGSQMSYLFWNSPAHILTKASPVLANTSFLAFGLGQVTQAAVADFDNDGDLDVVIAGIYVPTGSPQTLVVENTLFTHLTAPARDLLIKYPKPPEMINVYLGGFDAADYDKDGLIDIVGIGNGAPAFLNDSYVKNFLWKNVGNLTFVNRSMEWPGAWASLDAAIRFVDFNNDSKMDFILAPTYETLAVFINNKTIITTSPPAGTCAAGFFGQDCTCITGAPVLGAVCASSVWTAQNLSNGNSSQITISGNVTVAGGIIVQPSGIVQVIVSGTNITVTASGCLSLDGTLNVSSLANSNNNSNNDPVAINVLSESNCTSGRFNRIISDGVCSRNIQSSYSARGLSVLLGKNQKRCEKPRSRKSLAIIVSCTFGAALLIFALMFVLYRYRRPRWLWTSLDSETQQHRRPSTTMTAMK